MMDRRQILRIAADVVSGKQPDLDTLKDLARFPEADVFQLLSGADFIREHFFGKTVHLCTICNAKSGRCREDCRFCAQSAHYPTDAPAYELLEHQQLVAGGKAAAQTPIHRYSIVTTGKGLGSAEVAKIAAALADVRQAGVATCASLGILGPKQFDILKQAGVTRYHHNLETAESHFKAVCTTHRYADRIETIRAAKAAGLAVCSGGIFGIGESDEQVLELALTLSKLAVDAVPVNFLVPIPGTPLQGRANLTPLRCLKIIALFRFVLPRTPILICGGREANLKALHPLVFHAGASGIMTGHYLTTSGRCLDNDLSMLEMLGFRPDPKE